MDWIEKDKKATNIEQAPRLVSERKVASVQTYNLYETRTEKAPKTPRCLL